MAATGGKEMKLTVLPWKIWAVLVACMIVLVLSAGCAEDRFLTKEQDQEYREACQEYGCTVVPNPVWERIEKALGLPQT
jgi:membrane-associated PAP2 superfamily phosphatase